MNRGQFLQEHDYFMEPGNYRAPPDEVIFNYSSWKEFLAEWGDADISMNRIHRFDFEIDDGVPVAVNLFYIKQRKADLLSCHVQIDRREVNAIAEFLKPHAEYNLKLWEGVL